MRAVRFTKYLQVCCNLYRGKDTSYIASHFFKSVPIPVKRQREKSPGINRKVYFDGDVEVEDIDVEDSEWNDMLAEAEKSVVAAAAAASSATEGPPSVSAAAAASSATEGPPSVSAAAAASTTTEDPPSVSAAAAASATSTSAEPEPFEQQAVEEAIKFFMNLRGPSREAAFMELCKRVKVCERMYVKYFVETL
jgi:cell division septation protein DedD